VRRGYSRHAERRVAASRHSVMLMRGEEATPMKICGRVAKMDTHDSRDRHGAMTTGEARRAERSAATEGCYGWRVAPEILGGTSAGEDTRVRREDANARAVRCVARHTRQTCCRRVAGVHNCSTVAQREYSFFAFFVKRWRFTPHTSR